MIGNVVSAPVIIVILVFNYILTNAKVTAKRFMLDLSLLLKSRLVLKLKTGLHHEAYLLVP